MRARALARVLPQVAVALMATIFASAATPFASVAVAATGAPAQRSDAAREDRWAAQVAPEVVVGDVVWLSTPSRPRVLAIYTPAVKPPARAAVIVVHGMGVNPDWGVIGVLRSTLPDDGFATLSVQMPVLAVDAPPDAYSGVFPEAEERLAAARAWLVGHGYARIAVVSHSLGAAMTDAWLAQPGAAPIVAWIAVGMPAPFSQAPREPVLDVVAEHDLAGVVASAPARAAALANVHCSRQIRVAGTDHYFDRAGAALAATIAAFLDDVLRGDCRR